jgi:hypothetical protein
MMMRVTGTVVDGSLMLDQRLNLPDQSRVNVTLEPLDAEASARRSDLERLTESFARYRLDIGPRTWEREDLYDR